MSVCLSHTHTELQVVSRNPYLIPPKLVSPTETIPLGFFLSHAYISMSKKNFNLRSLTPTKDLHTPNYIFFLRN